MDSRAHVEAAELASDPDRLRVVLERSGQLPTPGAAGNLLRWLLRHDPERVARASEGLGEAMTSLEARSLEGEQLLAQRGW